MKKVSIAYAAVIIASGTIIGATYSSLSSAANPPLVNLSQPAFLLTSGITLTSAIILVGLIHALASRIGGKTMPSQKSTSKRDDGNKAETETKINKDPDDLDNGDGPDPNLKSTTGETSTVSGFRVGTKTGTGS